MVVQLSKNDITLLSQHSIMHISCSSNYIASFKKHRGLDPHKRSSPFSKIAPGYLLRKQSSRMNELLYVANEQS